MSQTTQLTSALSTLLPTYNGTFPPDLVNLSTSLLAQSRNRAASTLKPDEEIARPFACAEIACKRLQSKLRLPRPEEWKRRPPCPPRVYAKLVAYLDGALPAKTVGRKRDLEEDEGGRTGGERDAKGGGRTLKKARGAGGTSVISTMSTKKRLGGEGKFKTPTKTKPATPAKQSPFAGKFDVQDPSSSAHGSKDEAPPHILPLIRRLCAAFATTPAVPHIYTGFCIVYPLTDLPSSLPSSSSSFEDETTALAIALFFMVLAKMQRPPPPSATAGHDDPFDSVTHLRRTERAIQIATGLGSRTTAAATATTTGNPSRGDGGLTSIQIDTWLTRVSERGWAQGLEWWDNVPEDVMDAAGGSGTGGGGGSSSSSSSSSHDLDVDNDELGLGQNDDVDAFVPASLGRAAGIRTSKRRQRRRQMGVVDEDEDEDEDFEDEDEEDEEVDEKAVQAGEILLPGLGTMVQEVLDWGSKSRMRGYEAWKRRVLEEIRRRGEGQRMRGKGTSAGRRSVSVRS